MKTKLPFILFSASLLCIAVPLVTRADVLEMQNGDRYSGKVVSVSASVVVLNSEILGKINVPRAKVASLVFGTNAASIQLTSASTAPAIPKAAPSVAPIIVGNTNADLAAELRALGGNTNFIGQIRQQMLAGSPQAAGKFDEMVNGLMSGQINMNDLRKQAQESAAQLRELQKEMGSQSDETLDAYLKILDAFISESATDPAVKSN